VGAPLTRPPTWQAAAPDVELKKNRREVGTNKAHSTVKKKSSRQRAEGSEGKEKKKKNCKLGMPRDKTHKGDRERYSTLKSRVFGRPEMRGQRGTRATSRKNIEGSIRGGEN